MGSSGRGLLVIVLLCTSPVVAGPLYSVTDLGTLGGTYSEAIAVNNSGQIIGQSYLNDQQVKHAFLYSAGSMSDLGVFRTIGMNNTGVIVGSVSTPTPVKNHAATYSAGTLTDLGTFGGIQSWAYGVNDAGQMVGEVQTSPFSTTAVAISNGVTTQISLGGVNGIATSINASGEITGFSYLSGQNLGHAFLFANGNTLDLDTLGGEDSEGLAINNSGMVTGFAGGGAFLYAAGHMALLGAPGGGSGSTGRAINSWGDVVGDFITADSQQRAFLYTGGKMSDLNSLVDPASGWMLLEAEGINDSGYIVGLGYAPSGDPHGFLLTPVPEPGMGSIVLIGTSVSFALGRRRWTSKPPRTLNRTGPS